MRCAYIRFKINHSFYRPLHSDNNHPPPPHLCHWYCMYQIWNKVVLTCPTSQDTHVLLCRHLDNPQNRKNILHLEICTCTLWQHTLAGCKSTLHHLWTEQCDHSYSHRGTVNIKKQLIFLKVYSLHGYKQGYPPRFQSFENLYHFYS